MAAPERTNSNDEGDLDDVALYKVMLAVALAETGGDLTPTERAWADQVLGID
jgi:hypothetical protein